MNLIHSLLSRCGKASVRRAPGAAHLGAQLLTLLSLTFAINAANAAPAAGTSIGNQASATYTDSSLVQRTVTSNTVQTIVQQVASFTLTADGDKTVTPGGQISYPHTLTNTGNGTDSFNLTYTDNGPLALSSVNFYADANGDGIADNTTAIVVTPALAAGEVFNFVVVVGLPGTATGGDSNALTVTAASALTPAVTAFNTNSTTVTNNAVINVTKSIDVSSGAPGTGPRTFTLTYTNSGNASASALTLTDVIPSGMTYVAGSARWSVTAATTLTDLDNSDNQSGIVYDFGITVAGRVTAVIASIAPGASGTLTFQAGINSGLAAGSNAATANTASYSYNDGANPIAASNTNTVQFAVTQSATLTANGDTVASATQGNTVSFDNLINNTGNGTDSFDVTIGTSDFPAGTSFTLYQADGVTPLVDTNGNGTPDTGPVAAGASKTVVLKVTLAPGATGGPYSVQKTATSFADSAQSVTVTDTLTAITANSVDLTNGAAGGTGQGPEVAAVDTNTVNPGATSRFTLDVSNGSAGADSFSLQASTDSTFATSALPSGWTVVFRDGSGAVVTNTGVINGGANKLIYADVTVPAGTVPGTTDLYFRVLSPTSGASDRLHNALTVNTVRGKSLTPNNNGQAFGGGASVHSHTIANNGNVREGDGVSSSTTLALADSTSGFTSVLYWDKNNDGVLDAGDPVISSLADLVGGSNGASTAAGLDVGESATLFVKVFAPSGATPSTSNTTTLTATTTGVINTIAAPPAVSATDNTTVLAGQVSLVKRQALDVGCDGADTAYGTASINALPNACIRYEITATNTGVANVDSVVVSDSTPAFTTYESTVPAATTVGSISTVPADGDAGTVEATVGTLTPGQAAVITFGVRINP